MTVDDIFDALYLQAKDAVGLSKLRDIVLTDESINRLQFNRKGQEPIEFIKEKHGRWIFNRQYGTECSECGTAMFEVIGHIFSSATPNYCPNCGAKMDEPAPEAAEIINDGTYSAGEEDRDG